MPYIYHAFVCCELLYNSIRTQLPPGQDSLGLHPPPCATIFLPARALRTTRHAPQPMPSGMSAPRTPARHAWHCAFSLCLRIFRLLFGRSRAARFSTPLALPARYHRTYRRPTFEHVRHLKTRWAGVDASSAGCLGSATRVIPYHGATSTSLRASHATPMGPCGHAHTFPYLPAIVLPWFTAVFSAVASNSTSTPTAAQHLQRLFKAKPVARHGTLLAPPAATTVCTFQQAATLPVARLTAILPLGYCRA